MDVLGTTRCSLTGGISTWDLCQCWSNGFPAYLQEKEIESMKTSVSSSRFESMMNVHSNK